ncbi:MAG TPA: hypothetical protein VM141_11010 [Planctomycetota bacterium]|nr:hypothetical protein [Planctomycetota bacterium]
MPVYLRKVRRSRWLLDDALWVDGGDLQADALQDLGTDGNALSVWMVSDQPSLEQVLAAMAANCDQITNFDYVTFSEESLQSIEIVKCPGDTADGMANGCLHYHFAKLTATRLVTVAKAGSFMRKHRKEVRDIVNRAIADGRISPSRLKPRVREYLGV